MDDLPIILKRSELEKLIQEEAKKLLEKQTKVIDKIILDKKTLHGNSYNYKLYEKDENGIENVKKFEDVNLIIKYLSDKYSYNLNLISFNNLTRRLNQSVVRKTKLDSIFRDKVRIEKYKKPKE